MEVEIRPIQAAQTLALRQRVMWPDLPLEAVSVPGDQTALHFGAFLDDRLVAVGSVFPDGPTCRLRKLAVDRHMQGRGIARLLLDHAFTELKAKGYRSIWCDARVSAIGFYQRIGFTCAAAVFQKQGRDYVVATRRL